MKIFMKVSLVSLILMAFLISTATAASKLDLKRLLVLYLCDEGGGEVLKDSSGNGWDADLPKASWEKGVFNQAVRMKKTNSTVIGDIISSTAKTGELSIMSWINMNAHTTYNGIVSMTNPACNAGCCYRLMINPSKSPFWNAGQHSDKSLASFSFELNKWYHYAMICNGKVTKIHINGDFVGEVPENYPLPEFKEVTLYVGTGESPGSWQVEDCAFDEVMIWNKALDENEIKTVMQGHKVFSAVDANGKITTTWAKVKS